MGSLSLRLPLTSPTAVAVMMALGRAMTEDDNAGINGFLSNPLVI
jgi:hypothetical protein